MAWCLLAAVCVGAVRAGPGAGGPALDGWSHGWILLDDGSESSDGSVGVWHVPPRGTSVRGELGAAPGTIRRVKRLRAMPDAAIAGDDRLWLMFDGSSGGRRVLSLAVYPGQFQDTWAYVPPGRLRVHPTLERAGELVGAVYSSAGPAALIAPSGDLGGSPDGIVDQEDQRPELWILGQDRWRRASLPEWSGESVLVGRMVFVDDPDSLALLAVGPDGGVSRAVGRVTDEGLAESGNGQGEDSGDEATEDAEEPEEPSEPSRGDGQEESEPTHDPGPIPVEWTVERVGGTLAEMLVAGQVSGVIVSGGRAFVIERRAPGALSVHTVLGWADDAELGGVSRGETVLVARIEDLAPNHGWALMRDTDRLVVAELVGDAGDELGPDFEVVLREYSLTTGRVLHEGEAVFATPISPGEFRVVALTLLVMMVLVLVYVLRGLGGEEAGVVIPPGWALAPGGARMIAFATDALLAGLVTSVLLGIDLGEAFSISALSTSRDGHWALAVTVGIGFAVSTVLEWLTGRTPGKVLVGIRVVREGGSLASPGLGSSAVRNLCKWVLPPVALAALADPNGRHRGDVQAGTVVVAPTGSADGADDPPDSGH